MSLAAKQSPRVEARWRFILAQACSRASVTRARARSTSEREVRATSCVYYILRLCNGVRDNVADKKVLAEAAKQLQGSPRSRR